MEHIQHVVWRTANHLSPWRFRVYVGLAAAVLVLKAAMVDGAITLYPVPDG